MTHSLQYNRSIICRPTDKDTHTLLNTRLKRTEIMPFAPSVLEEYFFDVFSNLVLWGFRQGM